MPKAKPACRRCQERVSTGRSTSAGARTHEWHDRLAQASALTDAAEYRASIVVARAVLARMEGSVGSAVDAVSSRAYGLLGTNHFHLGDLDAAEAYTARALEESVRARDSEGIRTYEENLRILSATNATDSQRANVRWRHLVAGAQDVSDAARYQASNEVLLDVVAEIDPEAGPAGFAYRGKAYGLLGLNFFRLGQLAEASAWTTKALRECQASHDAHGITIYQANVEVIFAALSAASGVNGGVRAADPSVTERAAPAKAGGWRGSKSRARSVIRRR